MMARTEQLIARIDAKLAEISAALARIEARQRPHDARAAAIAEMEATAAAVCAYHTTDLEHRARLCDAAADSQLAAAAAGVPSVPDTRH